MTTNTYLQLTNRVLRHHNEVELTSSNFSTATGFYQECKDAINMAIFDIYMRENCEWPFAWSQYTQTLIAGTNEYNKTTNAFAIDWDSFYIVHATNITQVKIAQLPYDVYRDTYLERDGEAVTSSAYGKPFNVVRKPDNNILVTPKPDAAYSLRYDYYAVPTELVNATDTPSIPEQFNQVIINKALHYTYMSNDNLEMAAVAEDRYENTVTRMRGILIPSWSNVVSYG